MATYTGVLVDKLNIDNGLNPRFVQKFEIDTAGYSQLGKWRQDKSNDNNYWLTAGADWQLVNIATQLPGRVTIHESEIHFYNGAFTQNKVMGIPTTKELHKSLILKSADPTIPAFPKVKQKGTGYLLETNDYGKVTNDSPARKRLTPNIYWMIMDEQIDIPPLKNLWFGGGLVYGGKTPVYGKAVVHGWMVNYLDSTKKRYFQVETSSNIQFALGGKTGIVLLLANTSDPSLLMNKTSSSWNFSFCLGGAIGKVIEGFVKADKSFKFLQAGKLGKVIYESKGLLNNSNVLTNAGHLKTLFSGTELAVGPSYCIIDTPLEVGIEVGISQENSKVTMIS